MDSNESELVRRIRALERRVRAGTAVAIAAATCLGVALVLGAGADKEQATEIKATRIVVVDDQGKPRVIIGQDPKGGQRISRAAGLILLDAKGAERGGFSTLDDGSVVFGMDAPAGVGNAMPDRIGLKVESNGAAAISLINNQTGIPVRLISEDNGAGGVEFIDYDLKARKAFIRRIDYKGETKSEQALGGN
jgi:hypothetical protein